MATISKFGIIMKSIFKPNPRIFPFDLFEFSVRHESPIGPLNPVDIHGYQPPWKALSEFALHTDIDRLDPNGPQFQHLVGQVIFDGVL